MLRVDLPLRTRLLGVFKEYLGMLDDSTDLMPESLQLREHYLWLRVSSVLSLPFFRVKLGRELN
jgi:hypothetical protein